MTAVAFCPLCKCSHPAAEDHQCVPVADLIVDDTDPISGERFSTWATMANKDWTK